MLLCQKRENPGQAEVLSTIASTDHEGEGTERDREHEAELARIVAAWDELPAVLKGAMLAIVDSAGATGSRATAIVESTISAVLSGKRELNRAQIGKLARDFHVSPSVFAFNA